MFAPISDNSARGSNSVKENKRVLVTFIDGIVIYNRTLDDACGGNKYKSIEGLLHRKFFRHFLPFQFITCRNHFAAGRTDCFTLERGNVIYSAPARTHNRIRFPR